MYRLVSKVAIKFLKISHVQIHTLNRMPTAFEYRGPSGLINTG